MEDKVFEVAIGFAMLAAIVVQAGETCCCCDCVCQCCCEVGDSRQKKEPSSKEFTLSFILNLPHVRVVARTGFFVLGMHTLRLPVAQH